VVVVVVLVVDEFCVEFTKKAREKLFVTFGATTEGKSTRFHGVESNATTAREDDLFKKVTTKRCE